MDSSIIYLSGVALAASFVENKWMKGLGWLVIGAVIAMLSAASLV